MTLIAAVILVVAATTLFTLFVRAQDIPQPDPVSATQHLEERKARIYENLRDLQFEFRVGKLSDSDYQRTKLALQQELVVVLAEIDRVVALNDTAESEAKPKGSRQPQVATAAVAQSNSSESSAPGVVCPHCGAKFPAPMKFCGECGKAMA